MKWWNFFLWYELLFSQQFVYCVILFTDTDSLPTHIQLLRRPFNLSNPQKENRKTSGKREWQRFNSFTTQHSNSNGKQQNQ